MKKIQLTQGYETIVDDDVYALLYRFKWHFQKNKNGTITVSHSEKNGNSCRQLSLPRIILNAKKNEEVDHINHNQLDNRRENLRVCKQLENKRNRRSIGNSKYSPYKCVCYNKNKPNPWIARIRVNGVCYNGKARSTPELAALDYNVMAKKYFGEFAQFNNIMGVYNVK